MTGFMESVPLDPNHVAEADYIAALPSRAGWRHIARARGHNKSARRALLGWRQASREHALWTRALKRGLTLGCTVREMGGYE